MNAEILRMIVLLTLASACATVARPQERFDASQGDLTAAEAVGANKVPQAALHLQLAREEYDKGQTLMEQGENECADFMLQRAQADAQVAIALAKNVPVLKKCADSKAELKKVKARNAPSAE